MKHSANLNKSIDFYGVYEEIRQSQFLYHKTGKFYLGAHLSDTFFLNLYTLYYTRKQLNKRNGFVTPF